MNKILTFIGLFLTLTVSAAAQIASGGTYSLDQSVIAGGGGQNSAGGTYSLDGTIGQAVADTNGASNAPYKVQSGFWTAAPLAPTASSVSISGRVLASFGRGLTGAVVVLTDASGNQQRIRTSAFGYFRFTDVAAGNVCIFTVESKRFHFTPQVLFVGEDLTELIFNADSQNPFGQKIK